MLIISSKRRRRGAWVVVMIGVFLLLGGMAGLTAVLTAVLNDAPSE
jgi:hypothetical protein